MYVCMYVCMWRAAGAQVIEEQADKPANKRQVLRALVALSFYIVIKWLTGYGILEKNIKNPFEELSTDVFKVFISEKIIHKYICNAFPKINPHILRMYQLFKGNKHTKQFLVISSQ